ncbi:MULTISPECIES: MFS transporter [unclassified Rathayibacter]|uniref:MFS transporter n=1 Tax=unclassified Rathayibacter TaxID=2609250 RepID=UPI001047B42A|nr:MULTISPECIES: MFS transporter [unclassified Rathayibacter]TCL83101.1 putative glucitol transport protein GutA [Rathayibacter sp. PhB192]TCM28599.1 putative glucitol transport protein GutA [Rathayibacter sp. PhB179]
MTTTSRPASARAARKADRRSDPDRLSAAAGLAWTTTGLSGAVNYLFLAMWVFYGTDVLGLNPAVLGTLALVSKLLEAAVVVLAGWLVDRTPETRWGKARPYELAIIGVWVSTWFLFSTPDLPDAGKTAWLFVWLLLANVVFTSLLGANDYLYLARTFNSRVLVAKVATRTGFFTTVGVVAFNVALPLFIAQAGTSSSAWSMLALFLAIPLALIGLGRFLFFKEKYQTEAADAPKVTFRDIREVLVSNRYIWIVAGISFVGALAGGTGIAVYYFKYVVGDISLMSLTGLVPVLILPLMLFFPRLMKRFAVSTIITAGAFCGVLAGVLMIIANGNLAVILISSALSGLGILPITFLLQVLVIDNASYNQWSGRRRLESTMGAITAFAVRLGGGLGGAATGWVLGIVGYDGEAATQTPEALTGIVLLAGAFPAVLWIGVALAMRSYRSFEKMLPTITAGLAVVTPEPKDAR